MIRVLAIRAKFIYNISVPDIGHCLQPERAVRSLPMFNMNNSKNKRILSAVIIAILVFAMIITTLAYLFF